VSGFLEGLTGATQPNDDSLLNIPPDNTATPQQSSSSDVPTLALLRRILDRVADEVRKRGLVGEERLAQTLYLVLTSRLLDKQVSAGLKGHSASGKSYTVETVAKMFPRDAYLEFTAMSERALVYSTEEYAHRTLIVYEITALREGVEDDMTSYFRAVAVVGGAHRLRGHRAHQRRRVHHEEDCEAGSDEPDLHDHEDAGSRGERNADSVAGHR
jgi:hypothetical protein